jgi:hypothetical protein
MQTEHNIRLTASEISQLWSGYMNDSLSVCVLAYFLEKVEDTEIRPVIEYAFKKSKAHIQRLTSIFKEANIPVPYGFKEDDVNVNAPRLYSDPFMLNYINLMSNLELGLYSISVRFSARNDIHSYFSECLTESIQLDKKAKDVLLSKGLFVRPPFIQTPDQVDFVKQQSFLAGWFGDQRPLASLEIANLHANFQNNSIGKELLTGFSQAANSKEVGRYMVRGKEIAAKHMEVFGSALQADDLPVPMTWDACVTDSIISPFSDKLMMFQATAMNALGIGFYGTSVSTTLRRDLSVSYLRLTAEIAKYAEDGANIMIDNGWLEEPPLTSDRNELANV